MVCIPVNPSFDDPLSQPELDGYFDEHIDRGPKSLCRRETPLPDRIDRTLIEPCPEATDEPNVSDTAVAPNDDLEHHVASQSAASRFVGVVRLDLLEDARRRNAAAGPIRSTSSAPTGTFSDPRTAAFAHARPGSSARAACRPGALTTRGLVV
jgi:hypothetical protein